MKVLGVFMNDVALTVLYAMRGCEMSPVRYKVLDDTAPSIRVVMRRTVFGGYNDGKEATIPDLSPKVKVLKDNNEDFPRHLDRGLCGQLGTPCRIERTDGYERSGSGPAIVFDAFPQFWGVQGLAGINRLG